MKKISIGIISGLLFLVVVALVASLSLRRLRASPDVVAYVRTETPSQLAVGNRIVQGEPNATDLLSNAVNAIATPARAVGSSSTHWAGGGYGNDLIQLHATTLNIRINGSVSEGPLYRALGATIRAEIALRAETGVRGLQFDLKFNPAIVQLKSVEINPDLWLDERVHCTDPQGAPINITGAFNNPGRIDNVRGTLIGLTTAPSGLGLGDSCKGSLINQIILLDFELTGYGMAHFSFANVIISDQNGDALPSAQGGNRFNPNGYDAQGAYLQVTGLDPAHASSTAPVNLRLDEQVIPSAGQTFTVPLVLSSGTGIRGLQFDLKFNPAVVQLKSFVFTPQVWSQPNVVCRDEANKPAQVNGQINFNGQINNATGKLVGVASALIAPNHSSCTTDGEIILATLTFTATANGRSDNQFSQLIFLDAGGGNLAPGNTPDSYAVRAHAFYIGPGQLPASPNSPTSPTAIRVPMVQVAHTPLPPHTPVPLQPVSTPEPQPTPATTAILKIGGQRVTISLVDYTVSGGPDNPVLINVVLPLCNDATQCLLGPTYSIGHRNYKGHLIISSENGDYEIGVDRREKKKAVFDELLTQLKPYLRNQIHTETGGIRYVGLQAFPDLHAPQKIIISETFGVAVSVFGSADLFVRGIRFDLKFDPTIVKLQSVVMNADLSSSKDLLCLDSAGNDITPTGLVSDTGRVDDIAGEIKGMIWAPAGLPAGAACVLPQGLLATLTFTAVGAGTSHNKFENVQILNAADQAYPPAYRHPLPPDQSGINLLSSGEITVDATATPTPAPPPPVPYTGPALLAMTAPTTLSAGEVFTVPLKVTAGTGVLGFEFDLNFNPAVVQFKSLQLNPNFWANPAMVCIDASGNATSFLYEANVPGIPDNTRGTLTGVSGSVGLPAGGACSSNSAVVFATVTFTATANGSSANRFSDVKVLTRFRDLLPVGTGPNSYVTQVQEFVVGQ